VSEYTTLINAYQEAVNQTSTLQNSIITQTKKVQENQTLPVDLSTIDTQNQQKLLDKDVQTLT